MSAKDDAKKLVDAFCCEDEYGSVAACQAHGPGRGAERAHRQSRQDQPGTDESVWTGRRPETAVAEQSLAEPVPHEVHVLLEMQDVGTDPLECVRDRLGKEGGERVAHVRFRQVLQAHPLRALDELVKVDRRVRLLQVLVIEIRVRRADSVARLSRLNSWPYGPEASGADVRKSGSARAGSTLCHRKRSEGTTRNQRHASANDAVSAGDAPG